MPANYQPPVDYNPSGGDPYVAPPDISGFDTLANQAAQARTKSAGRNVINARNSYLLGANQDQRRAIGQKYYAKPFAQNTNALHGDNPGEFLNVVLGGDDSFLQGLADDTGNKGGNGYGGQTEGGQGPIFVGPPGGGGGSIGNGGNNGGEFGSQLSELQKLVETLRNNQQGSAPTLSVGSVSNEQGSAASRARARNSGGIVNTLASRRGRQASARPRRYF